MDDNKQTTIMTLVTAVFGLSLTALLNSITVLVVIEAIKIYRTL